VIRFQQLKVFIKDLIKACRLIDLLSLMTFFPHMILLFTNIHLFSCLLLVDNGNHAAMLSLWKGKICSPSQRGLLLLKIYLRLFPCKLCLILLQELNIVWFHIQFKVFHFHLFLKMEQQIQNQQFLKHNLHLTKDYRALNLYE